jgi:predicted RNA-binding Zn ribbon-like protein
VEEQPLSLAFVNSLLWRRGPAPVERVEAFAARFGLDPPPARGGAIRLREALYHLFSAVCADHAPDPSDVDVLDRAYRAGSRHLALGPDLRPMWTGPPGERLRWEAARDAVALLDGPDRGRLKQCPGETCGWLFVDGSRNHSRQWCDSRMCGNRARARRYYHRHRSG